MAEYTNDLRIKEIGIGEEAGAWGTTLNTQLGLLAEGFSYGVENLGSDANATITMANGASDEARSLYLKITSTSLSATRTVTLAPESVSKVWIIENATTGSQSITITQGGGQHGVTIPNGQVKIVYSTGDSESPSGVYDALDNLELGGAATAATSVTAPLIEGSTSIQTPLIEYTDGDDAITIADGGGITAANGITSTAAANTFGATSFNDADITNVGSIALDTIVSDASPAAITVGYGANDTLIINGTVGIGTSSPSRQLTVENTLANSGGVIGLTSSDSSTSGTLGILHFGNSTDSSLVSINGIADGATDAGALIFKTEATGGAIEERMRISSSGTATFQHPIVLQSGATQGLYIENNAGNAVTPRITNDANDHTIIRPGKSGGAVQYNNFANSAELMRLSDAGNVGIGDTSPFTKLHVEDTSWSSGSPYGAVAYIQGGDVNDLNWGHLLISQSGTTTDTGGRLSFGANGENPIAGIRAKYKGATYGDLAFLTRPSGGTNTERMVISSEGHVRFGPSGDGFDSAWGHSTYGNTEVAIDGGGGYGVLHIRGDGSGSTNTRFAMGVGDDKFYMAYDDADGAHRLIVNGNGTLGVGRDPEGGSATDYGIDLYASGHLYLFNSSSGDSDAFRMYDSSGTQRAAIDADGDYHDLSDERYKENIVDAPSVLDTISKMKVRSFNWKENGRKKTYGFIAQELNEVAAETVRSAKDDEDIWGVKHARIVPMLTKAIQEQQTLIEELQAEVKALKEA